MSAESFYYSIASVHNYIEGTMRDIFMWCSWYMTELYWQIMISAISYVLVCVFLYVLFKKVDQKAWQIPGPPERLLILTAHPDDEVMFFGPLIYWIVTKGASQIYLLCLSMGGNKKRKDELWSCAKRLGIPEANITIVMNTELPDDPWVLWKEEVVAECVLRHIECYKINAVVTFDRYGVSKHKNHISLYYAIAALCIERKVPPYCKMYTLESVNIFRKYTQILDLPISLLSSSYWYLITYQQRQCIKDAMKAHDSQYVWFRKLYMIFSRYTLINTLQEVKLLDIELDLQLEVNEIQECT